GFMAPLQLNPFMYKGNVMFCKEKDDWMAFSSKRNGKGIVTANSMEEFYDEPNAKVMFRVPEDKMNEYLEYSLKQCEGKTYTAFRTQPTLIEFEDRRANKGFGLLKVCELLDIKPENVMAFGDTSNDNEMLKEAGYAVCMCNGTDDTKALADEITEIDHNHDGFADYVNKRILQPNGWMQ
ncbi:MAG: HAD hydrolase family protein, partial [Erysipelotrichaceae bacterium]|nr:HAD hydrolase family protein [Erysipelotrichaceae bacterium]